MLENPHRRFSAQARPAIMEQLAAQSFDLLVIGGGILAPGLPETRRCCWSVRKASMASSRARRCAYRRCPKQ